MTKRINSIWQRQLMSAAIAIIPFAFAAQIKVAAQTASSRTFGLAYGKPSPIVWFVLVLGLLICYACAGPVKKLVIQVFGTGAVASVVYYIVFLGIGSILTLVVVAFMK
jgi:hypothetical protein